MGSAIRTALLVMVAVNVAIPAIPAIGFVCGRRRQRRRAALDRRDQLRAVAGQARSSACLKALCSSSEPEREISVGVAFHMAPDAHSKRTLVDVERTKVDEITLFLHPGDGGDTSVIYMSRSTAEVLADVIARAPYQEVRKYP